MKAIIAEDEPNQREELVRLLHEHWPELHIAAVCEDGLAALEALNEFSPQVAFLDIRMPGASGIEVARAASARQVHVVFVTAYDEYAVAAFEAGAADYLLKPVTPQRLVQAIERLRARVTTTAPTDLTRLMEALALRMRAQESRGLKWVTASIGDTVKMFPIDDVIFFQAQDKYVRVVTAGDEAVIRTPLKELIKQLDGGGLLADSPQSHRASQCHRPRAERCAWPLSRAAERLCRSAARERCVSSTLPEHVETYFTPPT